MKLTSDAYAYVVTQDGEAITVVLTQVATGETRTFFKASGSLVGHQQHMDSLTDELCESWFEDKNAKRKKKKEKKNV